MSEKDIDLERAVQDPIYRRQVIERLNAEAEQRSEPGGETPSASGVTDGGGAPQH